MEENKDSFSTEKNDSIKKINSVNNADYYDTNLVINIIITVLLIIVLIIIGIYFLMDESKIGQCETSGECGKYSIFSLKGGGYVCANDFKIETGGFATELLMIKYSNKNIVKDEPLNCLCINNHCEAE